MSKLRHFKQRYLPNEIAVYVTIGREQTDGIQAETEHPNHAGGVGSYSAYSLSLEADSYWITHVLT